MPLYRIHFTWKDKGRTIRCRGLDMTHPYFVSLEDLIFPESSSVIIDPHDDEMRREFGEARTVMIPFQNVSLIETLPDEETPRSTSPRVLPFTLDTKTRSTGGDRRTTDEDDQDHRYHNLQDADQDTEPENHKEDD